MLEVVAVEDVLSAEAVELQQEIGLAAAVEVDGVLPAPVIWTRIAPVAAGNLEVGQVDVDRVRHVLGAYLPPLDGAQPRIGVDPFWVERLATDRPQRDAVPFRLAAVECELACDGRLRGRQAPDANQPARHAAVVGAAPRDHEAHDLAGTPTAQLVAQYHLVADRIAGEIDDNVEPLRLGDLDLVVVPRRSEQPRVAPDLHERPPLLRGRVEPEQVAACVGGIQNPKPVAGVGDLELWPGS